MELLIALLAIFTPVLLTIYVVLVLVLVSRRRKYGRGKVRTGYGVISYTPQTGDFLGDEAKEALAASFRGAPTYQLISHRVETSQQGTHHVGTIRDFGIGDSKFGEIWSFVAFTIPLQAPRTEFLPEGSSPYRDYTTEWDEFNRAWHVRGSSSSFLSALLTGPMQQFLMTARGHRILLDNEWLTVMKPGHLDPVHIPSLLHIARGVRHHIPGFLWRDLPPGTAPRQLP